MTPRFPALAEADHPALVEFLTLHEWPFHGTPRHTTTSAQASVASGAFTRSEDDAPHWIEVEGQRAGLLVLHELSDPTPIFDLRLATQWRGRGLGRLVLEWLAHESFETWGKHRVEGHTRADNRPMRSVFERTPGWVLEASYRQAWPDPSGHWHDAVSYALLASDWRQGTLTPAERYDPDPARIG